MNILMQSSGLAFQGFGASGIASIAVLMVTTIILLMIIIWARCYRKAAPNTVMVITGGRGQVVRHPDGTLEKLGYRLVNGGGTFIWPVIERVDHLTLEIATAVLEPLKVPAGDGEALQISGTVQVRVNGGTELIRSAVEQFLNKTTDEIGAIAGLALSSRLRSVMAAGDPRKALADRDGFESLVRGRMETDADGLGLCIVTLGLKLELEAVM